MLLQHFFRIFWVSFWCFKICIVTHRSFHWFEGNFVFLLHRATILSSLSYSNSALKLVSGKNNSKLGIILEVNNAVVVKTSMMKRCLAEMYYMVPNILYSILLLKNLLSQVKTQTCFILITQCWFVNFFLSCALLHRYISSKIRSSFLEDVKMVAYFGGVHQYAGWLIFMYKVK